MSLATEIAPHLPYLRRYARALTGSQGHGDAFVRAALEAIVSAPEDFPRDVDPRLGLYKVFHAIWSSANVDVADEQDDAASDFERIAQNRLAAITPLSRQALLLTAMEGFASPGGMLPEQVWDQRISLETTAGPVVLGDPAGSAMPRVSSKISLMAAQISSVLTRMTSSTRSRATRKVSSPMSRTATPSAKRPTCSSSTRRPAAMAL